MIQTASDIISMRLKDLQKHCSIENLDMDPSLPSLTFCALDLLEMTVADGKQNYSKYVETVSNYLLGKIQIDKVIFQKDEHLKSHKVVLLGEEYPSIMLTHQA